MGDPQMIGRYVRFSILHGVSTRERPIDRARRQADRDRRAIGAEIRTARTIAGLSLDLVGPAAGMSPSTAGRIERGDHTSVTHDLIVRLGAVVGLDVRMRAFPSATGLSDAGQGALIGRFCGRLHPVLGFSTERPLPLIGDQRAWDGWITGLTGGPRGSAEMPAEFETRFVDEQAQTRRIMLKLRDSGLEHVVLVVADTQRNRAALKTVSPGFAELFPLRTRAVLQALTEGRHPGASGVVIL